MRKLRILTLVAFSLAPRAAAAQTPAQSAPLGAAKSAADSSTPGAAKSAPHHAVKKHPHHPAHQALKSTPQSVAQSPAASAATHAASSAGSSAPVSAPAARPQMSEAAKIEALLSFVEKSAGIRFIRNGKDYDGAAAGKHLRDKLSFAGSRVHTARDFIDGLASQSSLSKKPYRIRYADGREENSADFFNRKLTELEKGK